MIGSACLTNNIFDALINQMQTSLKAFCRICATLQPAIYYLTCELISAHNLLHIKSSYVYSRCRILTTKSQCIFFLYHMKSCTNYYKQTVFQQNVKTPLHVERDMCQKLHSSEVKRREINGIVKRSEDCQDPGFKSCMQKLIYFGYSSENKGWIL